MIILVALLLAAASTASGASVAAVAKRLARDTDQLATARTELAQTRTELQSVRRQHAVLGVQVEQRLVAIYKYGGVFESLTSIAASGQSVGEVSRSIDAIDIVQQHEASQIEQWQRLGRRATRLVHRQTSLVETVAAKQLAVEHAREQLDAARATAQAARAAVARMARVKDSPLLPKVGHPETNAVLAAAGNDTPSSAAAQAPQPIGFVENGVASMYADSFTGQTTSNGEKYDPNAFTAAHPSLPMGTWVTVSGPGGSVAVRINDRGPFVGGRIIDLSKAAAQAIGLPGIGQVTLKVQA